MQLKTAFQAASGTGLLPVFGWSLAVALIVGLATGGYVGWKWHKGSTAIAQNAQLRADSAAWAEIAKQQRQNNVENATAFKAAADRMGAIAQGREDDRESIRQWETQLATALELLKLERPDLDQLDLGPEWLRHWNKANTGPGADAPAARPGSEPAPAVPATPAGDQRQSPAGAGATRRGSDPLPRLSKQDGAVDPGERRMAGHRVAVVLQSGQADRHRRGWMSA